MTEIEAIFCQAGIPYSTPTSADFDALLSNFSGNHLDGKPSLITTPETEQHVAAIVSACVANHIEFVVRGGGHDAFGRSTVAQGVNVEVGERQAAVDLDIVVEYGVPIVDLSKAVRDNVTQRIERMTGLEVTEVNVYVDDIFLEEEEKAPAPERVQ